MRSLVLTLLLTAALALCLLPAQAAAQAKPIRVLFWTYTSTLDAQYSQELQAQGILFDQKPLTALLTLEELKSYNLIVLPEFVTLDAQYDVFGADVPNWWDVNLPNLRLYVQAGGGLLVTSFLNGFGDAQCAALDRLLGPWGAGFQAVQIIDPAHIATVQGMGAALKDKLLYCYTENITPHPVTQGVKRVYYPVVNLRWDDCYTTPPIVCDRNWTPLVQAMAGSYDAKANSGYDWQPPMGHDGVICAVRTVGRGRVALLSLNSYYTFFRPYSKETSSGEMHYGRTDGVILSGGDGQTPSDDGKLLVNLYRWLAEPGVQPGGTGVAAPPPPTFTFHQVLNWDTLTMPATWRSRVIPEWIGAPWVHWPPYWDFQPDPAITGDLHYYKALIGLHSAYSDGQGTVAQYAAAAKKAGYSLIAFTETFEKLGGPARWEALRRDCLQNTSDSFVCLPGIDIADPEGGRSLIFGQPNYPAPSWLTADGKYFIADNFMSIGFSTHIAAIARPGSSPHQYRMFKHFQGIPVATYRDGKQVDDGFTAYAWEVANGSNPLPLAVHEVLSPAAVAPAAQTGYQQIMPSDTVSHAADYFRCAQAHFFDCPARYFLSEGPIIDTWSIFNKDMGKPEENRNRYRIALGASSDAPIKEAVFYAEGQPTMRWTPNATSFQETLDGYQAWQHHWFMTVTDAQGRRALSPGIRDVPQRCIYRCGDHQNWLGNTPPLEYTGVWLPWMDIHMPVLENHEGDAIDNGVKGDRLAPMCEFPMTSNRVCVSDWLLGQRYLTATFIGLDAAPMRVTVPSKLYEGKVRVSLLTPHEGGPDLSIYAVDLKTRMEATRKGEGVWPWFVNVSGKYRPAAGGEQDITGALKVNLQPGDQVGNVVILGAGMRLDGTRLGLIAPADTTIKAGTEFHAAMLMMGDPSKAPYTDAPNFLHAADALTVTRGTLNGGVYATAATADRGGVAGTIKATPASADLPILFLNVNPRWVAGVWRSDAPTNFTDQFGFYYGVGATTLDVTKDAKFYAGNFVTADNDALYMDLEEWTADKITVRVNNPTDAAITATVETPADITGLKALKQTVTVPAGSTVRVKG